MRALIAEEAGRHLAPGPVIETIVAARLLAELGGEGLHWFERVQSGDAIVTLALHEAGLRPRQIVPGAAVADAVLYLDEDEIVLLAGSPPGKAPANLGKAPLAAIDLEDEADGRTRLILAHGPDARYAYLAAIEEWKILTAAALAGLGRAGAGDGGGICLGTRSLRPADRHLSGHIPPLGGIHHRYRAARSF